MVSSLLIVLDPYTTMMEMGIPFKWMIIFMPPIIVFINIWISPSGLSALFDLGGWMALSMGLGSVVASLSLSVWILNFLGLFPWCFTATSSPLYTLALSLPLWLSGNIYLLSRDYKKFLFLLSPEGVGGLMGLFLVVIEIVSLLLRPLSLGIRLMANMTAGHMMLALSETMVGFESPVSSIFSVVNMSIIILFEVGVALIQTYIFVSLLVMYWEESSEESSH